MGASVLRKKIRSAGFGDITVTNQSIANLTDTYDLVVTHRDLTDRARLKTASAVHVSVEDFMSSPRYDEIVEMLRNTNSAADERLREDQKATDERLREDQKAPRQPESTGDDVLPLESIVLAGTATSADAAIDEAGALLVAADSVEPAYVDAMHEREKSVSTYMGNGLAIPHGTNEAKTAIRRTGISFVRYPEPIDWNGKPAEFVVGIAGLGNDHMALLTKIAHVFLDKDEVARLRAATTADDVRAVLSDSK